MENRKRRWPALAAGALLLAAAGTAVAFGGFRGHGMHGFSANMPGDAMAGTLSLRAAYRLDGLSDAQREKLDALRDEMRQDMRERMDAARDDRRALRDAFRDRADVEAVRPLAERRGRRVTGMILARARVRSELAAILTEEQRQALRQRGAGCDKRRW